jgi:hypothetical protein
MTWNLPRAGLLFVGLLSAAGCDQLALGPEKAVSQPPATPVTAEEIPDLRPLAGQTYPNFVAGEGARYTPDALGVAATDRTRLWRAMAEPAPGVLLTGGGAEALVFRGCSEQGCDQGASIVAIDVSTGAVFAGVRDVGGADVLTPNERVEALLRLNSPTRGWDNPETPQP